MNNKTALGVVIAIIIIAGGLFMMTKNNGTGMLEQEMADTKQDSQDTTLTSISVEANNVEDADVKASAAIADLEAKDF